MVNRSSQKGFTLLELAIVLVIIGIILGAILKGQELINNAKAKRVLNDMKGLAAMYYTFYDRYGRFPGDCNNDGVIDYTSLVALPTTFNTTTGSFCYDPARPTGSNNPNRQWEELLQAQLISFSNARDVARHVFNGALYGANSTIGGFAYNIIVARQVPCFVAKVIDQSIDNSLDAGTGSIREIDNTGAIRTQTDPWSTCANGTEQTPVDIVYFFDRRPS